MRKTKIISIILVLFLCFGICENKNVKAYSLSQAEICIDAKTGKILHEYNIHKKLPIASTTKILTCITALESFDINKIIYVKKETTKVEGSSIYLKEGQKYSVLSLLYGLMLRSGNDAAETLAHIEKREVFINNMNKLATKSGAINSSFTNPHGLDNNNHYSTAYDLAKITSYSLKNDIFCQIVKTKKISVKEESTGKDILFYNKNKMLNKLEGCIGVKTGFTKKSGRCLVTACTKNNITLVCVVLNSPQMYDRTIEIINNCYSNYSYEDILNI